MKNNFDRRLMVATVIGVSILLLNVTRETKCQQNGAGAFNYRQSQETLQIDAEIKSRSLSGVVTDPAGATASKVLVERVRPGWGNRISAVLSDSTGHFSFAGARPGTHFLRISKAGFNTMLLKVRVSSKARSILRIELNAGN